MTTSDLAADTAADASDPTAKPRRHGPPSPVLTLLAALLGFAVITLDASVVNVALPAVGTDLGGGMAGLQWVVDAYTLTFAALMLSTGAFADRAGAARAFAIGVVVFTAASAACGFAPSLGALIGARALQGAAAAVVLPASLALVRQAFADPARRTRAVSLWAAGASVAVALGPVVGGALTTAWDWRAVFFVNLPLGAATLALLVRAPRAERRPAPLDLPGQLTATIALAALTLAVIEGGTAGLVAGGVAVAAGAAFLAVEARSPHPVVPLALFRERTVAVSVAAGAASSLAFYGLVFAFGLYFQQVQGRSALFAGLMFLPMSALIPVANLLAGRLAARFGPRPPMLIGQLLAAVGALLLLYVDESTPAVPLALLLVPLALGVALTVPPLTAAVLESVPAERAGVASGVLNSARQVAGGLGVAAFGAVLSEGFAVGLRVALVVSAVVLALSAAATLRLKSSPSGV